MIDTSYNPQHFVQRYILDILRHTEYARFRDLRPPKVDSNAFSYHLSQLQRVGMVRKEPEGYTLSLQGIAYIDRVSHLDTRPRLQPKIMTITAVYDAQGAVLAYPKKTQPMIGQLTLPAGMLHMDDATIEQAALRELQEKLGVTLNAAEHAGDCYMAVRGAGQTIMNALMHVFVVRIERSAVTQKSEAWWLEGMDWHDPAELVRQGAPATRNIMQALVVRKGTGRFFAEYVIDL